jgi:hypothetical protein
MTTETRSPRSAELDCELLMLALDQMVARFRNAAQAAGFSHETISLCIESELALIDRISKGIREGK